MESYAYATAAWLSLQATPLLLSPKLIVTLLSPEARNPTGKPPSLAPPPLFLPYQEPPTIPKLTPTDLEIYALRTLSLTLLTLSLLTILLTGFLPLTSRVAESEHSPYKYPTTLIITAYHVLTAAYMYVTWMSGSNRGVGGLGLGMGVVGSGGLACWGVGCLVFCGGDDGGDGGGKGGEGRVSGWPFRNVEERRVKGEKRERRKGL